MSQEIVLNGRWIQTYFNEDGVDLSTKDLSSNSISEFQDGRFEVRSPDNNVMLKGVYIIHENTDPPAIDWQDSIGGDVGKTFLAIYELTNNTFIFSASDEGMARPACFNPKPGHTIRKFKRVG